MARNDARILVVEDEAIIALEMESLLRDASCDVVACGSLQAGLTEAGKQPFDAVVLDVSLHGQLSFPLADILAEKDIPFIFVSGYELEIVPHKHKRRPFVGKPYLSQKLLTALFGAMNRTQPLAVA